MEEEKNITKDMSSPYEEPQKDAKPGAKSGGAGELALIPEETKEKTSLSSMEARGDTIEDEDNCVATTLQRPQNDTSKELGERSVHVDLHRDQIDTLGRSSANNSDADEAIESKTTGKSVGNSESKDSSLDRSRNGEQIEIQMEGHKNVGRRWRHDAKEHEMLLMDFMLC